MPRVYERAFRVRHYECDAYGHVNHANFLRYMQEAAMDASADAGYDLDRYTALHRQWWIRETEIDYLRPLTYGQTVIVKTWVKDFHRVRSRRAYELREAESGEIVARAHSDWVYLNTDTNRPVTIPDDMIAAFSPEASPDGHIPRDPFPKPPPPPPGAYTMRREVEWRDLDPAGHVNNANYMAYCEDAGVHVAAAFGWTMARMIEAGFGIVARHYRLEYKQPALIGDTLEITTYIADFGRTSAVRCYELKRAGDNAVLARARARWVWVDLKTGRPMRIPQAFAEDFAANIAVSS